MKQVRSLALAVLALSACAAVLADTSTAFTLENLPALAPKETRSQSGKAIGGIKFETTGGSSVECTGETETGVENTSKPPTGEFHLTLSACKSQKPIKGVTCTGSGDSSGQILVLGRRELVFDKNPATSQLVTALLSVFETSFSCVLITVSFKGSTLCLHLNPTVSSTKHEFHCNSTKGVQEETKYWDAAGTEKTSILLASFNGGAFEEAGQNSLGEVVTTVAVAADQ